MYLLTGNRFLWGGSTDRQCIITLDDSTVTATASTGTVNGIQVRNESGADYDASTIATQLLTLSNGSGVTASGVYATGIDAVNLTLGSGKYSTATQTIALANANVSATATTGSFWNSAAVSLSNLNGAYYGTATQALTATASALTGTGSDMDAVRAINNGDYGSGVTVQTVTLASNALSASDFGAVLSSVGYSDQVGTVTGNIVTAPYGVYMYENLANQIVTVSGNTFSGTATTNAGSGQCVGPQCAPAIGRPLIAPPAPGWGAAGV